MEHETKSKRVSRPAQASFVVSALPESKPLFPWFGGKRWLVSELWPRLGPDVRRYIEPFAGGLAMLLGRPGGARPKFQEVCNDEYGHLVNAWRSLQKHPDLVASLCQGFLHEADLHARTRTLLKLELEVKDKVMKDPDWCDPMLGAWWLYCVSNHINTSVIFTGHQCKPNTMAAGVNRRDWVAEAHLVFERIRNVRFLCGDFARVLTPCELETSKGITAVYLDPPYDQGDQRVYGTDAKGKSTFARCVDWVTANATNPTLRIALSGYSSCYGQAEMEAAGMKRLDLTARRGFAKNDNCKREALWLSPACINMEDTQC